ncbi:MAG: hypothetical protein K6F69_01175, partial [Treponema sp.]|nr:hypothetical protein [Treponema sp.]
KIANYSLDISDYLSNLSDVSNAGFSGESNSETIDIPSVDLTKSVNATVTGGQLSSDYANTPISVSNFPVTFSATVPLDNFPAIIESITIGEGSFSVDSDKDGVAINITSFSINGTEYEKTGDNLYSLEGLTISASDSLEISGNAKVTLGNVSLSSSGSGLAVPLKTELSVKKATTAVVNISDELPEISFTTSLPDYVTAVNNATASLKLSMKNGLPEGNDIAFALSSSAMNINSSNTFTAAATEESSKIYSSTSAFTLSSSSSINMAAAFCIGGVNAKESAVSLSNIEFGKSYSISYTLYAPNITWESISVDASSLSTMISSTDSSGKLLENLNIADMLNDVKDGLSDDFANVKLPDIPLYMYVVAPQVLSSSFSVNIGLTATYEAEGNTYSNKSLIGTSSGLKNSYPTILEYGESICTLSSDDFASTASVVSNSSSGAEVTLAELFNSRANITSLDYSYSLSNSLTGTFTISSSDLSEAKAIGVYALIDLPLSFSVTDEASIDVLGFVNSSEEDSSDLFGRDEATDTEDIENYAKAIDYVELRYSLDNKLISGLEDLDLSLKATLYDNRILSVNTEDAGENEKVIRIDGEDILDAVKTYPFKPRLNVVLPEGTIAFLREGQTLGISAVVSIKGDGENAVKFDF